MGTLKDIKTLMSVISPVKAVETAMSPKLISTAGGLRGGLQQTGQLLQQLKGKPGVKQAQVEQLFGRLEPKTKLTPEMLAAAAKKPKLMVQRSAIKNPYDEDLLRELTQDLMWGPEMLNRRTELFAEQLEDLAALGNYSYAHTLLETKPSLARGLDAWEKDARRYLTTLANDGYVDDPHSLLMDAGVANEAEQMALRNIKNSSSNFTPMFEDYQRQPSTEDGAYFENVLRAPPQRAREIDSAASDNNTYYHFNNPGQLGHIRGSISPNQTAMNLDEIQSDPLHYLGESAIPELQGIYGKLGRSALDRAAAANIPYVNIPTGAAVTSVRDPRKATFYNNLYDKTLNKELYEPLQDQGVRVNRSTNWNNIELTPELMEEIKKGNLLNYKRGGLAQYKDKAK